VEASSNGSGGAVARKSYINGVQFQEQLVNALFRYSKSVNDCTFTLLDSHDTMRIATVAEEDHQSVDASFAMLFALPGSLCIYYGSEIYLAGGFDPDNRRPMPWNKLEHLPQSNVRRLIKLRHQHPAMTRGQFEFLTVQPDLVIFKKYTKSDIIYYLFTNGSNLPANLPAELQHKTFQNLVTEETVKTQESLTLPKYLVLQEIPNNKTTPATASAAASGAKA
jgi:glycosidase